MITTIKEAKSLAKEYNKIKTDRERLEFLKQNNGKLKVVLDNDCSQVEFDISEDVDSDLEDLIREVMLNDFDEYHGWGEGVQILFEFAGIKAEPC